MLTKNEFEQLVKRVAEEKVEICKYEMCYADMPADVVIDSIVRIIQESFVEHSEEKQNKEMEQPEEKESWFVYAEIKGSSGGIFYYNNIMTVMIGKDEKLENVIDRIKENLKRGFGGREVTIKSICKM